MSVIVASYNRADLLPLTIRSVLAQTFRDFEVVVVDDGSTDDTADVVAAFSDERIRYVKQDNQGLAAARNTGLAQARGRYIALLDSDDLYEPHCLETLAEYLDARPDIGLVSGGWIYIDAEGRPMRVEKPWEARASTGLASWLFRCHVLPCSVMIRKHWFDQVHGFDSSFRFAEDVEVWLRIMRAGCQMAWVPEIICRYRLHASSHSRNATQAKLYGLRALEKFFADETLPQGILDLKSQAMAMAHLRGVVREIAAGQTSDAMASLLLAVRFDPSLAKDDYEPIVRELVGYSEYPNVPDPIVYIKTAFKSVSPSMPGLIARRRIALGRAAAARIFKARVSGPFDVARLAWTIACNDPRWLTNRGLLKMLVQCATMPERPLPCAQ